MTKEEHDLIEKEMFEKYISHAKSFSKLSSAQLNEIDLEATLKGDVDVMYIAELARSLKG